MATVGLRARLFDADIASASGYPWGWGVTAPESASRVALLVRAQNSRLAAKTPDSSTHELMVTNAKVWPKCGHGDQAIAELLSKIAGAT